MVRHETLADRIRARPPEADFHDVETLLKAFGWTLDSKRGKGSHKVFIKKEHPAFTVPTVGGRRVKRTYLDKLCDRLGLVD